MSQIGCETLKNRLIIFTYFFCKNWEKPCSTCLKHSFLFMVPKYYADLSRQAKRLCSNSQISLQWKWNVDMWYVLEKWEIALDSNLQKMKFASWNQPNHSSLSSDQNQFQTGQIHMEFDHKQRIRKNFYCNWQIFADHHAEIDDCSYILHHINFFLW